MATTRDEQAPVSWEEVLLAINPYQGLDNIRIRELVNVIQETYQDDHPLDPEVEEYFKMLIASSVCQGVSAMIGDLLTPRGRNQVSGRPRGRSVRNMIVHGGRQQVRLF
jgi:hypothetical protein